MRSRTAQIWMVAVAQLWLAHAIGYLVHEYAHSFTAWILHWKANPLALNYGQLSVENVLLLSDIDENVDYGPIFAAGRGPLAALIAVAGVLIGNGISYLVSRWLYRRSSEKNMPGWAMFFFLLCVMSVGNFLCYVPVRTFASHADMATTAQGLNVSPWVIAIGLGIPFGLALVHFFARILPDAELFLFPESRVSRWALVLLSTFMVFEFFGSAGLRNYGSVSHWLSVISEFVLFPLVTVICWLRSGAGSSRALAQSAVAEPAARF
jgi:hypothetical protein